FGGGHLRDLGHEVAHLLDLLLGFVFADRVDFVLDLLAGRVHRLELVGRHASLRYFGEPAALAAGYLGTTRQLTQPVRPRSIATFPHPSPSRAPLPRSSYGRGRSTACRSRAG